MRKMGLFRVTKLEKDDPENTIAILSFNGYTNPEGIKCSQGHENGFAQYKLAVECKDEEAPELGQQLLVIVESVPELGQHVWDQTKGTDNWSEYVAKRRSEITSPQPATKPIITSGRKFR